MRRLTDVCSKSLHGNINCASRGEELKEVWKDENILLVLEYMENGNIGNIRKVIGNISNILRSHASRRIYSSRETVPIRPNWWQLRTSSRQVTIQIFATACYVAFQERDRKGIRKIKTLISHAEGRQNAETREGYIIWFLPLLFSAGSETFPTVLNGVGTS